MADQGLEITITLDGTKHLFVYNNLTAADVRDCRRETGFTINRLIGLAGDSDIDIDSFAALLWLARRQAGERGLRYDAVAQKIRPQSDLQCDVSIPELPDDEEDGDLDPE